MQLIGWFITTESLVVWDAITLHLPLATFISDCLRNLQLPLWIPYLQYGQPLYANPTASWYLPSLIFSFLGYSTTFFNLEYVLHFALSGFFMFEFLFEILDNSQFRIPLALIGGTIYCFAGPFLSNTEHFTFIVSMTWLPILFLMIFRYLKSKRWFCLLLAGLCGGVNLVGGYPEFYFNSLFVLVFFISFEVMAIRKNLIDKFFALKTLLLYTLFSLFASSIVLIPFINSLSLITRKPILFEKLGSLSPLAIFTTIIPGMIGFRDLLPFEPSMTSVYFSNFAIFCLY